MVIYYKQENQLCNRLWALLPGLSLALELKTKFVVFGAYKGYLEFFPNLIASKKTKFLFNKSNLQNSNFFVRFGSLLDKFKTNIPYTDIKPHNPLVFVDSFSKRHEKSYILKHKDEIVSLFQPPDEIKVPVNSKIKNEEQNINIGIHIRRGDYKDWAEGKFYFSLEFYYQLIEKIYKMLKHHNQNKNINFIICSNENFDVHEKDLMSYLSPEIKKENIIRFENDDIITDLYALSVCDYIVGPHSTFSQWASFIGKPKWLRLEGISTTPPHLQLADFKKIKYLDTFEDNTFVG